MNEQAASQNPYHAPEADTAALRLAPDTEFLLSGECILCAEEVTLPRICITSAVTQSLIKRTETIQYRPVRLRMSGFLLTFVVFVSVNMLRNVRTTAGAGTGLTITFVNLVPLAVMAVGVPIVIFIWWLYFRHRRKVEVTWYVTRQLHNAAQKAMHRNRVVSSGLLLVMIATFLLELFGTVQPSVMPVIVIAYVIADRLLRVKVPTLPPTVLGEHNGLLVLHGFGADFLRRLEELIEQHNSANQSPSR